MGELLRIDPNLHFPIGYPFEVPDGYNGKHRGTWYYRSPLTGALRGPFTSMPIAGVTMVNEEYIDVES